VADNLNISECRDFGLATVMLRKNADPAAVGVALQVSMPGTPACVTAQDTTVIGTGPGTWMVFAPTATPSWAADLAAKLHGVSVSDQSGGYVVLKLAGPAARSLLQKGAFIDLDASTFNVGSVVTTVIAHIGVTIWQIEDPSTFHVALFRSFAHSFHVWLDAVAPQPNA
jgi:sarcosine oxidase subunit gamma